MCSVLGVERLRPSIHDSEDSYELNSGPLVEHLGKPTVVDVVRSLTPNDQPPTVKPIATEGAVCVDGTFTIGMRRLVYHDPKIVAALWTGSGDIAGHDGRRHIAVTTSESNCGFGL